MQGFEHTIGRAFRLKVSQGEEALQCLKDFCSQKGIKSGFFTAIGAFGEAEIYEGMSAEKLRPVKKSYREPLEIAAMMGNITIMDNQPYIHCHAALGREDFSTLNGHLARGVVSLVCEIVIVEFKEVAERKLDPKVEMNTW